jgi:hypothetical protein
MKKAPVKMKKKSAMTMKKKSMAKMVKKSPAKKPLVGKQKSLPKELQEAILKSPSKMLKKSGVMMMDKSPSKMKAPIKKSKQKVEQDYARNAIADYKAGDKKQANYEKKKELELASGESGVMMKKNPMMMKKDPMMMKTNQSGGGYAAKNPSAPARQLKKLGTVISKHMKSN